MPLIFKMLKTGTLESNGTLFTAATGESFIVSNIRLYNTHTQPITITAIEVGSGSIKQRVNPADISIGAGGDHVYNSSEITLDATGSIEITATGWPGGGAGLNYLICGAQRSA